MTTRAEFQLPGAVDPGILLWDKSAGETSHDVVARVRRETGFKVGHAGTLDPFATGLLLILLGRATRLQRFFLPLSKEYRATARLGWVSSTGDSDGELEHTGRIPAELAIPLGPQEQMVPMTSAARVGGERLYRKAHRGETTPDRPVREITVHRSELLSREGERAVFELEVSSGTYVRNLIEDLDDAYCEELRRTGVGPLSVDDAGAVLSPLEALSFLPSCEIGGEELDAVRNGRPIECSAEAFTGAESVTVAYEDSLVAIAEPLAGKLKPSVVLDTVAG